jgi:hypothetical protein
MYYDDISSSHAAQMHINFMFHVWMFTQILFSLFFEQSVYLNNRHVRLYVRVFVFSHVSLASIFLPTVGKQKFCSPKLLLFSEIALHIVCAHCVFLKW